MVQHDIWRHRKKSLQQVQSQEHTLTSKQDHLSLNVYWSSLHLKPPTSQIPSIHGITPQSKMQNQDPFQTPPSPINFVSSLGGFLNHPAQRVLACLGGDMNYLARICTELLSKPRHSFGAPTTLHSDLF